MTSLSQVHPDFHAMNEILEMTDWQIVGLTFRRPWTRPSARLAQKTLLCRLLHPTKDREPYPKITCVRGMEPHPWNSPILRCPKAEMSHERSRGGAFSGLDNDESGSPVWLKGQAATIQRASVSKFNMNHRNPPIQLLVKLEVLNLS